MREFFTRSLALTLALLTLCLCACTSGETKDDPVPQDPAVQNPDPVPQDPTPVPDPEVQKPSAAEASFLTFDFTQDEEFLPKNIYDESLYVKGIVPVKADGKYSVQVLGEEDPGYSIVLNGEWGHTYEVKCPADMPALRAAVVSRDPRDLAVGKKVSYDSSKSLKYFDAEPTEGKTFSFMYTSRFENDCLVLYTGTEKVEVEIYERTMLQPEDTEGHWFIPSETFGDLHGGEGSFANILWTAEEFIDNLYEPMRAKYPEYITREVIGKDQSGQHDMYGYVYTPEEYKCTLFIAAGVHGDEDLGYHGIAAFMSLIADATENSDPTLWFMRNNVRFIVIPVVNVWAASQDPMGERTRLRYNSEHVDLNRDFKDLTQAESQNVVKYFEKYADEVDMMMDCHTADGKDYALWYNYILYAENTAVNYKTTNHMYHRMMELGIINDTPSIAKIPGSYNKGSEYLEGIVWNRFKVPSITVEHADYKFTSSMYGSGEELTIACEAYGNFLIQNAIYFCNAK
jgi:hypothetical protein